MEYDNGINVRRIHGNEFIAFAQFDLAHDPEISARLALPPDSGLLNHLDKGTGAAVQNGQLEIIQFDNGVVDANASKRREQVLGGGDEHALLHQTRRITDASHVASAGFDREAVKVGAMENDSRSRRRGQNPQTDRSAAVQPHSCAGYRSTNCLFVCHRGRCKSFAMYQLTGTRPLVHVAKQPHSVAWQTVCGLTYSNACRCSRLTGEELACVLRYLRNFRACFTGNSTVSSAVLWGRRSPPLRTSNPATSGCSSPC